MIQIKIVNSFKIKTKKIFTMLAIILLKASWPVWDVVEEGVDVAGVLPLAVVGAEVEFKPGGIGCPRPSLWKENITFSKLQIKHESQKIPNFKNY